MSFCSTRYGVAMGDKKRSPKKGWASRYFRHPGFERIQDHHTFRFKSDCESQLGDSRISVEIAVIYLID